MSSCEYFFSSVGSHREMNERVLAIENSNILPSIKGNWKPFHLMWQCACTSSLLKGYTTDIILVITCNHFTLSLCNISLLTNVKCLGWVHHIPDTYHIPDNFDQPISNHTQASRQKFSEWGSFDTAGGLGAARGSQKPLGIWCKILQFSNFQTLHSNFRKALFYITNF